MTAPQTARAAVGDELSAASYLLQIAGDSNSAEVTYVRELTEPYLEQGAPDENPSDDQSVITLLDAAGGEIDRIAVDRLVLDDQRTIFDPTGELRLAGPNYRFLILAPKLSYLAAARLQLIEADTGNRFDVDIEGIDRIKELVLTLPQQPPADLSITRLHGAPLSWNKRIDFVFLAEGYTASEEATFLEVAEQYADYILSLEPWNRYSNRLNFWAVFRASQESGVSFGGVVKDTAYDLDYTRYKTALNLDSQIAVIMDDAMWANADYSILLVNDRPNLGSSYPGAWTASYGLIEAPGWNFAGVGTFEHEMTHWGHTGHETGGSCGSSAPFYWNISFLPDCPTWADWIGDEGVDCLPGANECDEHYRGTNTCTMISQADHACPLCRQAIARKIIGNSTNGHRVSPQTREVVMTKEEFSKTFSVGFDLADSSVDWAVDGHPVMDDAGSTFTYHNVSEMQYPANHTITATVIDTTHWLRGHFVRQGVQDKLYQKVEWSLTIVED